MSRYVTTGSAIERVHHCRASVGLPHVDHETEYSWRGTVIHEYLENVSRGEGELEERRRAALELVPIEDGMREACEQLDLSGLDAQLELAAEVAIAYNFVDDTARELGRGEGRKYDDVSEDEIPCTIDVVGELEVAAGRRGLVIDWKTGWTTRRPIAKVKQISFSALAASRCFGFDVCEGQLVNLGVDDGAPPVVQRVQMSGYDLDAYAAEVRRLGKESIAIRESMRQGKLPERWHTGSWCEGCPSFRFCPAQHSMLSLLVSRDYFDELVRNGGPIPDDQLVRMYRSLAGAKKLLATVEGIIRGAASSKPLFLGHDDDGAERWLGTVVSDGNEKLDGVIAYDVLEELHGEDVAVKATSVTVTKDALQTAIKGAVPRGKGAASIRHALSMIRERGGAERKQSATVKEYRLDPAARPELDKSVQSPPLELAAGETTPDG